MGRSRTFIQRQSILVGLGLLAYLGVRLATQGDVTAAHRNARRILELEKAMGLDLERGIQALFVDDHGVITLANWVYVWGYWPVLVATLVYLGVRHRDLYFDLRNAMFVSGAIGLVIFATYAVAPPRLFSIDYVDTVAQHSAIFEVIHPPSLANRYAAVPSFHFGWILLVAIAWYRAADSNAARYAAFALPAAMAFSVVVTANHWVLDIVAGGIVSLVGLAVGHHLSRIEGPLLHGAERLSQVLSPVSNVEPHLHVAEVRRRAEHEAHAQTQAQHYL